MATTTASVTDSWAIADNALDFLQRAVTEANANPAHHKYAVLDLAVAVETLIKARLIREHWTLVIQPIGKGTTKAKFLAGAAKTVTPGEGLDRLRDVVGLDIPTSRATQMTTLMTLRNQVVHFAPPTGAGAATTMLDKLGTGLSFALWFLDHHFAPDAPDAEAAKIEEVKQEISAELTAIEVLAKQRLDDIKELLDAEERLYQCPYCTHNTLAPRDGAAPECLYCYRAGPGEEVAEEYLGYPGAAGPVETCTACETPALLAGVHPVKDNEANTGDPHDPYAEPHWLCFACSMTAAEQDIINCLICGDATNDGDSQLCGSCYAERFEVF